MNLAAEADIMMALTALKRGIGHIMICMLIV